MSETIFALLLLNEIVLEYISKAGKRAGGSPGGKRTPPPMDICNTWSITNVLAAEKKEDYTDSDTMILTGHNLGERHRDLNSKVTEAVVKQINFEELKSEPEKSDVDKLFKIDLASKFNNIDYILEVLKCGDIFYITRALKCLWLYTQEYSPFINIEYLKTNIFPFMSIKMKRKMLTAISMHMKNSDRAIDFYKYCIEDKLNHYAFKFLVLTPDGFKIYVMKTVCFDDFNTSKYLKKFIGDSFELALAYLAFCDCSRNLVKKLCFLYTVSNEKYLNILENFINVEAECPQCPQQLGIRISKDILNKHKQRVFNNPLLYINMLNKSMVVKHLTIEDVESIGLNLLPKHMEDFWSLNFYHTYKFILDKIPANRLIKYIKQIYISEYNGEEFEMRIEFYKLKYYEMLSIEEQEAWALEHIERDEELPGIEDYIWYKFVSLQKAFSGIKHYIFLTPNKDARSLIVNILPETARNGDDINKILCYYYGRHVNESEDHKASFINKIIELHDVYSFNNECWMSFDKLLYSLDVYTTGSRTRGEYKFRSLIYHILHDKELPEALREYMEYLTDFFLYDSLIKELSEERKAVVAKYWLSYLNAKIKSLMVQPDKSTVKEDADNWENGSNSTEIHGLVCRIWNTIYIFKRPNEDCPEAAVQYMESRMDIYESHEMYKTKFDKCSEEDFLRWLKYDTQMAVDGIFEIRCNTYRWNFRLCRLFRKLKVYFPHDVGKEYLDYFMNYLTDVPKGYREYRNIKMAVVAVFYLADLKSIICFLDKNVPITPKIDRMNIDNRVLQVQKAICRLAYHPRPPIPLNNIQKYIAGDYVHYCLPMIYNYFANLPSNVKFIESLLDAPLSIQKHGLRLAFKGYDAEILKPIIKKAWKETKNVSLRMVLYETLFDRILIESEEIQKKLYDVLKLYTSELNHDDHENVYSLLVSDDFPHLFKGDFIETAWLAVSKLPNKSVDIKRQISVICHMESYMHLIQREFPRVQIIDDHIKDMLYDKKINQDYGEYYFKDLIKAKWNLTAKYIVTFINEMEQQKTLELLQTIMTESLKSWNIVKNNTYIVRKFMQKFIKSIMDKDPKTIESCANIVTIYNCIHNNLKLFLKKEEIYLIVWEIKLSILCRNIIHNDGKKTYIGDDEPINMSIKKVAQAYGKVVGKMVRNCVKNGEFYHCFYQSIADIVNNIGGTICKILKMGCGGFIYYMCDGIINIKMTETHMLALYMLPRYPNFYWNSEHTETVSYIRKQSVSQEVMSFFYQKYVLSDCVVRRYVK